MSPSDRLRLLQAWLLILELEPSAFIKGFASEEVKHLQEIRRQRGEIASEVLH